MRRKPWKMRNHKDFLWYVFEGIGIAANYVRKEKRVDRVYTDR